MPCFYGPLVVCVPSHPNVREQVQSAAGRGDVPCDDVASRSVFATHGTRFGLRCKMNSEPANRGHSIKCGHCGRPLAIAVKRCIYCLRHTFATMLARKKVHPKVAQKLLRHTDIRLTLDIYTHADADDQTRALASLPDISGRDRESGHHVGHHMVTTNVTILASAADDERQG